MKDELIVPDWPAPGNVVAATTTRRHDDRDLPDGICFLNQVHGAAVVSARELRGSVAPLGADAVTGDAPGDICAVRTADCLPILLSDRNGSEVAAVHGGWRGVLAGVIENTVAAMRSTGGELLAWLGPAISQPAFEVGAEVREAFTERDPAAADHFVANERGRWQADLYGLALQRLADAGVSDVYGGGFCTFKDPERFWSYRRNPECGRMVTYIGLRSRSHDRSYT